MESSKHIKNNNVKISEESDDDCECCGSSSHSDIAINATPSTHKTSGDKCESEDECACCHHVEPASVDHHSHNDKQHVSDDDDDCACCGYDDHKTHDDHNHAHQNIKDKHSHAGIHHDHQHSHDNCCGNDTESDDCECCDHGHKKAPKPMDHHSHQDNKHVPDDDDDCACCGHDDHKTHDDHNHGHQHGHDNCCGNDTESDDCECCDHGDKKPSTHHHSMDHAHGIGYHEVNHESDDDCACCDHDAPEPTCTTKSSSHDHSHDHNHTSSVAATLDYSTYIPAKSEYSDSKVTYADVSISNAAVANVTTIITNKSDTVQITIEARVCNHCDEKSDIPHANQVTRLRVANLCCAGEERIIRSCIEGLHGVEAVAVNIVGRYAIIKHCPEECCAPTSKLVNLLNDKRLGASVQEANDGDDDDVVEPYVNQLYMAYWCSLLALFIAGVIAMRLAQSGEEGSHTGNIPALVLYVVGTTLGIIPVVQGAYISIIRKTLDIHILMLIAVIGALAAGEFFDACLLVTLFVGAGLIEDTVMRVVRRAIKISNQHMTKTATLASGESIKLDDIKIGDTLAVRTGDMICCDGEIIKGDGVINESALTGESLPIQKKIGMKVFGGTIVQNGYIEFVVTVAMKESAMNILKQTVDDMQADRGEYAKLVDTFAYYWTPVVLAAAIVLVVAGGEISGDYSTYTHKGLVLLVLACPCAIVIAAPIPSVCTIAMAARHGVLIKGSSVIERLALVDTLAVDKTGTLTKGYCKVLDKLSLTSSSTSSGYNVMELAAAIESKSTHPLANAIVADHCGCIAEMDSDLPEANKIKVIDGVGISGMVLVHDTRVPVHVGNERLLSLSNTAYTIDAISSLQADMIEKFRTQHLGCSIIYIAVNYRIELLLAIADEIREESKEFVSQVCKQGLSVTMLTGDHHTVAEDVAKKLNIDIDSHCKARLLPQDKLLWVQTQQDEHKKKVIMIGDGINDATALTMASCGAAMGEGGSAMTVTAADLVIMSDNLLRIPSSIELCRITKAIIVENCLFSVIVKIVASVLAIIGMLSLWNAVLVDLGTLLVVIINGTRPFMFKHVYSRSNLDKFMKAGDKASHLETTVSVDNKV